MDFGERIKSIRGQLSQKDFAEKIGVHVSTAQLYEAGNIPKGDVLKRIQEVFNVNINWLLTNIGNPYINSKEEQLWDINKSLDKVFKRKTSKKTLEERISWVTTDIIKRKNLSVQDLAISIKQDAVTINDYMNRKSKPSERFMFDLCKTHNVCPIWLFTGIGAPYLGDHMRLSDDDYWEAKSGELDGVYNEEALFGSMMKKHIPDNKARKAEIDLSEIIVDDGEHFLDVSLTDAQKKTLILMAYNFLTKFEKEVRRRITIFIHEFIYDENVS